MKQLLMKSGKREGWLGLHLRTTMGLEVIGMGQTIEAIYKEGALHPLQPLEGLEENVHVRVTIEPLTEPELEAILELAFATYEGLTDEQIAAIEAARFDQEHFFHRS